MLFRNSHRFLTDRLKPVGAGFVDPHVVKALPDSSAVGNSAVVWLWRAPVQIVRFRQGVGQHPIVLAFLVCKADPELITCKTLNSAFHIILSQAFGRYFFFSVVSCWNLYGKFMCQLFLCTQRRHFSLVRQTCKRVPLKPIFKILTFGDIVYIHDIAKSKQVRVYGIIMYLLTEPTENSCLSIWKRWHISDTYKLEMTKNKKVISQKRGRIMLNS